MVCRLSLGEYVRFVENQRNKVEIDLSVARWQVICKFISTMWSYISGVSKSPFQWVFSHV